MAKTQFSTKKGFSYKNLVGMVVAIAVFFVLLSSVIELTGKYFMTKKRIREFEAQKHGLEIKEALLMDRNAYFETEEGEKQLLREKYNAVYPGEEIVIITEDDDITPFVAPKKKRGGFWQSIKRGLGFE